MRLPDTICTPDQIVAMVKMLEANSTAFRSWPPDRANDLLLKSQQVEMIAETIEDPALRRDLLALAISFRRCSEVMWGLSAYVIMQFSHAVDKMKEQSTENEDDQRN